MEPIYSPNILYNKFPEGEEPTQYTGSYDKTSLKELGFTDEDLLEMQKTVDWNEEDNEQYLLTAAQKELCSNIDFSNTSPYKLDPNKVADFRFVGPLSGKPLNNFALRVDNEHQGLKALEAVKLDMSSFSGGFTNMFQYLAGLKYVDFTEEFNASSLLYAFRNCFSLSKVKNLNTSQASLFTYGFYNCLSLKEAPTLDLTSATNLSFLFSNCYKLKKVKFINFENNNNDVIMTRLFYNCVNLREIEGLVFNKATALNEVFYNCYSLEDLPIIESDKLRVNARDMFRNCRSLTEITFGNLTFSNLYNMFDGCYSLRKINNLKIEGGNPLSQTFNNCYSLEELSIHFHNDQQITGPFRIQDMGISACYNLKKLNLVFHCDDYYFTSRMGLNNTQLQEINILNRPMSITPGSSFFSSSALKNVNGDVYIRDPGATSAQTCYHSASKELEEIRYKYVGLSSAPLTMNFVDCSKLSNASVLYMVEYASTTTTQPVTIMLHPTAKARVDADTDIQAALAAKTNITITT